MTLDELKQITEDYFHVSINKKNNKHSITNVRKIFWYIAFMEFPDITLQELGDKTGHDYTNVHWHLNRMHENLQVKSHIKSQYENFVFYLEKFRTKKRWIEQYNDYSFSQLAKVAEYRKKQNRKKLNIINNQKSKIKRLKIKLNNYKRDHNTKTCIV